VNHIGSFVQARERIEDDFGEETPFVHAEIGDRGRIIGRTDYPEVVTVAWSRHGTVTDCHVEQIRLLAALTPPLRLVG
jgi:hypothetical protein